MNTPQAPSGSEQSVSAQPDAAGAGPAAPHSDHAGSQNTLGDGRTAGGGYNADKRDALNDEEDGESHGRER